MKRPSESELINLKKDQKDGGRGRQMPKLIAVARLDISSKDLLVWESGIPAMAKWKGP